VWSLRWRTSATPGGAKAPLYITEFGYLSLLAGHRSVASPIADRQTWHTENERANWYTDRRRVHTGVIYEAELADARCWLTIHTLSESGSDQPGDGRTVGDHLR
jgi:hypothetical protein